MVCLDIGDMTFAVWGDAPDFPPIRRKEALPLAMPKRLGLSPRITVWATLMCPMPDATCPALSNHRSFACFAFAD